MLCALQNILLTSSISIFWRINDPKNEEFFNINVINVLGPTEEKDEEKDTFYAILDRINVGRCENYPRRADPKDRTDKIFKNVTGKFNLAQEANHNKRFYGVK